VSLYRDAFEQCPRCGVELVDARSARGCRQCRGLWLREDVLTEMVIEMLPVAAPGVLQFTPGAGSRIPCPACKEPMALVTLADVLVDRCARHGVWLDADELPNVLMRAPDATATPDEVPEPAPTGVPQLRFTLLRGDVIEIVEVSREVVKLGRLASAHVRLDEGSGASRMHAVIEATQRAVTIIDLGTDNGTYVNGARVTKALLAHRDVIQIGDTELVLEINPAPLDPLDAGAAA
jgi:Zn-finger nucleic acid-binding protein